MPLDDYTRGETLGRGAFGTVFRATGPAGEVAIKLLAIPSKDRRLRFERELDMTLRLGREPGFVPVIEGGLHKEQAYLIMPLLSGGTLRQRLNSGGFSAQEACVLIARLADAMGTAHAEGVIHRDLKPENILFDSDGRAFVADMGLARWIEGVGDESLGLSKSGQMRGTMGYMPPEQLRSSRSVSPAADVFALGAILHECLSGEPAFGADTALAVVARITDGKFARLDPRALGLTPALVRVVERCLNPDPERRFPHGTALAVALRAPEVFEPAAQRVPKLLVLALFLALAGLAGAVATLWLTQAAPAVTRPLDDGGDGVPVELRAALEGFKSLRWVEVWGSEVGQIGPGYGVFPLEDGILTTELVGDPRVYRTIHWAANGRRGQGRKVPVRGLDEVGTDGRVLVARTQELHQVYERGDAWPEIFPTVEADTTHARTFAGRMHWLGHVPGGGDAGQGGVLYVQAEGGELQQCAFPAGVWRNGEVSFLGGPERGLLVVARGEGADPERLLIALELNGGRELWRVEGLRDQHKVRCSPEGNFVVALEHDAQRMSCYRGDNGAVVWRHPLAHEARDLAMLDEEHCAFTSGASEVSVLRLADGELVTRWTSESPVSSLCALAGTTDLITNSFAHATLERRDWTTGESRWKLPLLRGAVFGLASGPGASTAHTADVLGVVRWGAGEPQRIASWTRDFGGVRGGWRAALNHDWAVMLLPRVQNDWRTWAFPLGGEREPFVLSALPDRCVPLALAGDSLLAGTADELVLLDLASKEVVWRRELANAQNVVAAHDVDFSEPTFVCATPAGKLLRVNRSPEQETLGMLPGRPRQLALEPDSERLAAALERGGVVVGVAPTFERWGSLDESAGLAWHRGRLLGLDERGLTVWETGFVREVLDLDAVNGRGASLRVEPDGRVLLGTAYGSVLVFEPRR